MPQPSTSLAARARFPFRPDCRLNLSVEWTPLLLPGLLMQEFLPHILLNQGLGLRTWRPGLVEIERLRGTLQVIPAELRESAKAGLERLRDECVKLRLKASYASVSRMLANLGDPAGVWRAMADDATDLESRIIDELREMTCFAVDGKAEELYRAVHLFGKQVADRFPSAVVDVEEAGKCLALDRATACVFHVMRVLEVGLRALAADLQIGRLEENWQRLLDQVRKAVNALPRSTPDEKQRLSQRSEAAAHLQNVKDAWRNDVMHPHDVYTVEQAHDVFNHARALMASLASFL